MTTHLVQLGNRDQRRVALVEEPQLRILAQSSSVYALAEEAVRAGMGLSAAAEHKATEELVDYDRVYQGQSAWRILAPIDHPQEPTRCVVSGTGLTHLGSARDRQAMHRKQMSAVEVEEMTDSMKMFRWGIEGGRPPCGVIGTAPEWFYKGTGTILRTHGEALEIPGYAEDGGEEAEIAGIYWIAPDGMPRRLGMTVGNEFSDHCFEKKNYLNLAGSKLRNCSLGPELVIDPEFQSVPGKVTIKRGPLVVWSKEIRSGEAEMCHSLANIEHHHFKFEQHRRPGDVHVHFLGADCLSFGDGIRLADEDRVEIWFEGFGRSLENRVVISKATASVISAVSLG
ncbi:MAG: GguC protein [Acidobacteria bacterium]|nr:GguC protein [Acidobacteriota bacterium]